MCVPELSEKELMSIESLRRNWKRRRSTYAGLFFLIVILMTNCIFFIFLIALQLREHEVALSDVFHPAINPDTFGIALSRGAAGIYLVLFCFVLAGFSLFAGIAVLTTVWRAAKRKKVELDIFDKLIRGREE